MIGALLALGLALPTAIPVQVQGVAKSPDSDHSLAALLLVRITGDAEAVPVSLRRMVLPAPDKAGDPAELLLVVDNKARTPVVRLGLVAADTRGPARYEYDGPPVPLPGGRLLLCAPVDSTWMRQVTRRKLSRKLSLALVRTESGEAVEVTVKALKRPKGFEPDRWADRAPTDWAKSIPGLKPGKEIGHFHIPAGAWRIDADMVVPRGATLHIDAGTTLLVAPSRSIFAFGRLVVEGTVEAPVVFRPSGAGPWGTLAMIGAGSAGSIIRGARLVRGSMWFAGARDLNGTISLIDTDATIERCRIEDGRGEDALHVERSTLTLRETAFSGISSDGLDLEGAKARIEDCSFTDIGDDAIDAGEGSNLQIDGVLIRNARGKALSVGQTTTAVISESFLLESGRGISAFEGGIVTASTSVVAFARRAGIQATGGLGAESGRVRLERCLLWQNGGPPPSANPQITVRHVRFDVPIDLSNYAPVDGPGGLKVGPSRLPDAPPALEGVAVTGSVKVLVGAEDQPPAAGPFDGPLQWLLLLGGALLLLGALLVLERKLRI